MGRKQVCKHACYLYVRLKCLMDSKSMSMCALYPFLSPVSDTPQTQETISNIDSETAFTIMGLVIGILLTVVMALTTALVFVAYKFLLSPKKKQQGTNAQGMACYRHSM